MLTFTKLLYTTIALNFTPSFCSCHATNVSPKSDCWDHLQQVLLSPVVPLNKYWCPTGTSAIDGHSDNRWFFQNDLIKILACMPHACIIHNDVDRLKACIVQISICSNHAPKIIYIDNYLHGTMWLDQVRYNPWPVQEQIVDHGIITNSFPLLMHG